MRFLNCYFQISVMLILAMALACGNSRNGKVTGPRNNKSGDVGGSQTKMLTSFVTKISEVISKSGKASKPTPDTEIMPVLLGISRAYEELARKDQNQAKKNDNLNNTFGFMKFTFSEPEKGKLKIKAENDQKDFIFTGIVDKTSRKGTLNAEKVPANLENETPTAPANIAQDNSEEEMEGNGARRQPKTATPKTTPSQPAAAKGPRFLASVQCFDSDCGFMVVNFVDTKAGAFHPMFARYQIIENGGQSINLSVLHPDQIERELIAKNIKITDERGGIRWSAEIPETTFMIVSQTTAILTSDEMITVFHLTGPDGSSTEILAKATFSNIRNTTLHDSIITLNPKK